VDGLALAVHERPSHAAAYAKATETIGDLLAFVGAQEAALRLGEEAVVAATRGRANRLANADHANIVRTSRAADLQLRAIRRLEREGRLEELAPELAEIARLRVRNPTLSLRELARRCDPPATKAAAHRRLARIQRLAEL
jgi:DNA-binding protein WhiA